jgi:hypothetical protein
VGVVDEVDFTADVFIVNEAIFLGIVPGKRPSEGKSQDCWIVSGLGQLDLFFGFACHHLGTDECGLGA